MFTTKKIALVSVINDLVTDNRVNRTCQTLIESGYQVVLIGRKLPTSMPLPNWPFKAIRMHLLFTTGPLFYFFFNVRLFFLLLFKKADLLYANDLDTLLPNYLVSKLKNLPLIYDSHELFCEVPELINAPFKRNVWLGLEGWIVPKLKHCITVNESIASIFNTKYKTPFTAVKNISGLMPGFKPRSRAELGLPADKKILLMQGAGINIDRGAEDLLDAMPLTEGMLLLIIGSGDVWPILEQKVKSQQLQNKVWLIKKLPKAELMHYTFNADLGLSIDKDTNMNYRYSLPNKLYDYIHAGVPVMATRLPEIERILNAYGIGDFIDNHQPETISNKLTQMLQQQRQMAYRSNMAKAQHDLSWDVEKQKLLDIIHAAKGLN